MSKVIVITGNIASGKSLVTDVLTQKGHTVLYADQMVHRYLADEAHQKEIESHLSIVKGLPKADFKTRIRYAMFENEKFREWYLPWIHQELIQDLKHDVKKHQKQSTKPLFLEIPIYFEAKVSMDSVNQVWLVWTPPAWRMERWKLRKHASYDEMKQIELLQIPDAQKFQKCDVILVNSGDPEGMERQVVAALELSLPVIPAKAGIHS